MSRNNDSVVAHQNRIHESELGDRARDLRDLILGVGSGIARVRDQAVERTQLEVGRKSDAIVCLRFGELRASQCFADSPSRPQCFVLAETFECLFLSASPAPMIMFGCA